MCIVPLLAGATEGLPQPGPSKTAGPAQPGGQNLPARGKFTIDGNKLQHREGSTHFWFLMPKIQAGNICGGEKFRGIKHKNDLGFGVLKLRVDTLTHLYVPFPNEGSLGHEWSAAD